MPATPTYVALAEVTLAATATSITLPVPSGYRDLVLVANAQGSTGGYFRILLNGDTTATNYYRTIVYYEGSLGSATVNNSDTGVAPSAGEFALNTWQFMDASATDKQKTILGRQGTGYSSQVYMDSIRWTNTSAITSIQLSINSGTLSVGSSFNLYGIEA